MRTFYIVLVGLLIAATGPAEARHGHRGHSHNSTNSGLLFRTAAVTPNDCVDTVMRPCYMVPGYRNGVQRTTHSKPARLAAEKPRQRAPNSLFAARRYPSARPAPRLQAAFTAPPHATGGFVAPLAAKVAEIQASCGASVVSGVRHTNIAGTRRLSLHASGQAADMAGNPGCIYSHLHGWPGGYSTDYSRMRHVHISWGGFEQGRRFVHGGGGHRHRYVHHRRHRVHYAQVRP